VDRALHPEPMGLLEQSRRRGRPINPKWLRAVRGWSRWLVVVENYPENYPELPGDLGQEHNKISSLITKVSQPFSWNYPETSDLPWSVPRCE
jgi:hypothetical protein